MHKELDLSQADDVLEYLAETPFASSEVEPLSGGRANYVFRLRLKTPYKGWRTIVMKHGKGWYPTDDSLAFSVERQVVMLSLFMSLGTNGQFSVSRIMKLRP